MKQIVEEVLQAEAAAAATLKAAREQAAGLHAKAETASLDRINEAKQQCQQRMQAAIQEASRAAEQVKAQMIEQAQEQARDILTKNPARLDQLVEKISQRVLGAPSDGASPPPLAHD